MWIEKTKNFIKTDKFLIILFLAFFLSMMNFFIIKDHAKAVPDTHKDIATWMWSPIEKVETDNIDNYILSAKENKIKTIFWDISNYIDLIEMPKGQDRGNKIKKYKEKILYLLRKARENNVKIEALIASPKWSNNGYRYIPSLLFDFVIEMNSTYKDIAFSGIHFDIEPYNQTNYNPKIRVEMVNNLLTLVKEMVDEKIKNDDKLINKFSITFDIPYWFVGKKPHSIINFKGNNKAIGFHMADILNKIDNGNLALISYQRNINKTNDSLDYVNNLIDYLNKKHLNVKFYLGLETSDIKNKKLTFYGLNKNLLIEEIDNILKLMEDNEKFKGIAIHHFESFLELKLI